MKNKNSYHQKYALYENLIASQASGSLNMCIVIPCHNEPDITSTLKSLVECTATIDKVEVIVVINHIVDAKGDVVERNIATKKEIKDFIGINKPWIPIHTICIGDMPLKTGGVGMARKIGMDEASRRLDEKGIIVCLDADCIVEKNYLVSLDKHFKQFTDSNGCSVSYCHPTNDAFPEPVINAIAQYELHLRYFIDMQRQLSLPYAYHTVGSSMAVVNKYYKQVGGMNKRKAGEDFYFIQKLIKQGKYSNCTTTTVYPSPRISNRVPFGTGKAMKDILTRDDNIFYTYHPTSFEVIEKLFSNLKLGYRNKEVKVPKEMTGFITQSLMDKKIVELIENTRSEISYVKRMFHWFDAFMLMKALHYLRDNFYELIPVMDAINIVNPTLAYKSLLETLEFYRELDKQ